MQCKDYSLPNDWYVRFCNVEAMHIGYANRVSILNSNGFSNTYYWEPHTMADTISGLLAQIPRGNLDNMSGPAGYGNGFEFKTMTSALAGTVKLYSHWDYSATESSYGSQDIVFGDYEIHLRVYDKCGTRFIRASLYGDIPVVKSLLNPTNSIGELWIAEHVYSEAEPGVACGEELTGTHGECAPTDTPNFYYRPAPKLFGPLGDSSVKVIAAPNNSLLSCGGYGG